MSDTDLFLTSIQDWLLQKLMQTPKLYFLKSCSAPSHAYLYTLIVVSLLIAIAGYLLYQKYVANK